MNAICRRIRQRAAEEGVEQVRQMLDQAPDASQHVANCKGCQRALDALTDLDAAFAPLEPIDAPDDTVAALLARVSEKSTAEHARTAERPGSGLSGHARLGREQASRLLAGLLEWLRAWLLIPAVRRSLAMVAVATFVVSLGLLSPSLRKAPESSLTVEQIQAPESGLVADATAEADAEVRSHLESLGYLASTDDQQPPDEAAGQYMRRKREEVARQKRELQERLPGPQGARERRSEPASPAPRAEAPSTRHNVSVAPEPPNDRPPLTKPKMAQPMPVPPPPPPMPPPPMPEASTSDVRPPARSEPRSPARQSFSGAARKQNDAPALGADDVSEKKKDVQKVGATQADGRRRKPDAEANASDLNLEEEITVTAESPLLDESKIRKGATISEVELEKVPTARDPWATVTQAPGVLSDRINVGGNESGQQAIFVAPSTTEGEDAFAVDGVNITDMESVGASPTYYDFDAFEEMQLSNASPDSQRTDESLAAESLAAKPAAPAKAVQDQHGRRSTAVKAEPSSQEERVREEQARGVGGFQSSVESDNGRIEAMRLEVQHLEKELEALEGGGASASIPKPNGVVLARSKAIAVGFLAERERVDRLTFLPAVGYWANTYLPGDPARRLLEASLAARGLDALSPFYPHALTLHEASRQPVQPFDPPRSAALALYADIDRHGAAGPARALLQVALRATDRHSGHRAPLALAVILDLSDDPSKEDVSRMRTLLRALLTTVESGDRVQVLFAGRDVSMVMPDSFRHGAVMVAFEEALAAPRAPARHDLATRLITARDRLVDATAADGDATAGRRADLESRHVAGASESPSAALGAAGVLVVSAQASLPVSLARESHNSALVGVPVSVVALGTEVDRDSYSQVALAGQGGLRHLIALADAQEIVDRELTSIGRVVARALRLNIRLAPGVQLVDVIGSHRLGRAATVRARAAEHQIDQMAQRDLGIRADRGEDDDGIQILIPSFYAGDAHVVLLDVVAPGPGKVADVSVRYKDLVRSKNGAAQARVKLGRSNLRPAQADRRIRSVRKSLLAARLRVALDRAAEALAAGRSGEARQRLQAQQDLLAGLAAVDPGWASDRDLGNDRSVLGEYLAVLEAGAADNEPARDLIADSLRVAADRKVLRIDDLRIDDPQRVGPPPDQP